MVRRELRAKYKGSALGVLWYLVNPLVLMAVYAVMFRYLLKAVAIPDYPLFLFVGLIVWTFFSQSLLAAATSLVDQASLVSKVRFPRETVPAAVVSVQLVPFLALLAIAVPVALIVRDSARRRRCCCCCRSSRACTLFALGLALIVSVAHAYFRDVQPVLGAALLPWFFVTPIFFRVQDLPGLDGHPTARVAAAVGEPGGAVHRGGADDPLRRRGAVPRRARLRRRRDRRRRRSRAAPSSRRGERELAVVL